MKTSDRMIVFLFWDSPRLFAAGAAIFIATVAGAWHAAGRRVRR